MTRAGFGAVVFTQLKCGLGKQQDLGKIGWLRGGAQLVSGKYITDALSAERWHAAPTVFVGCSRVWGDQADLV